jgi:hypothetical protein
VDEVNLPPPEFTQFLVAQAAVQVHDQGGVHVFAREFPGSVRDAC